MPGKGNPDKIKGKGFDKRPENINRKGRPRRMLTKLMRYFQKEYGKRPPKSEVIELMEYLMCLPSEKLKKMEQDENTPAIIRAYARLLIGGEAKDFRRVQAAEMITDRVHGKVRQQTDITTDGKPIQVVTTFIDAEQKALHDKLIADLKGNAEKK